MLKKLGWVVGDGADINIWDEPWLSLESPLRPMGSATQQSTNLVVRDLLYPGTGIWDRNQIQALLPFEEDRILRIQPSIKGATDTLRWLGTKDGKYSVKSGYDTAMMEQTEEILEGEATM